MHPVRKQRLLVVLMIVVFSTAAIGLAVYALRGNINLFYPPAKVVSGEAPLDTPIRVGGMVVANSVKRSAKTLDVEFQVTDYEAVVTIRYSGILPDLFDEGQGAVAAGRLNADKVLIASEVLAKHDENYMPPEITESLKKPAKAER